MRVYPLPIISHSFPFLSSLDWNFPSPNVWEVLEFLFFKTHAFFRAGTATLPKKSFFGAALAPGFDRPFFFFPLFLHF